MHRQLCLNCMKGYMLFGICTECGARKHNSSRLEYALPSGHELNSGRYVLGRVLGAGGFGITYLTWDNQRNIRVTIKELYPRDAVYRDGNTQRVNVVKGKEAYFNYLISRFKNEAYTISLFQAYPEILKVFSTFNENGTAYYVMEYLEGQNLAEYVQKTGSSDWQTYKNNIFDAIQSLRILHNHGLIHRDISPDNIFILSSGKTKLIDFGSVRYRKANHFTTIFKIPFAPPEMYSEKGNQGPWTDIYALCATCYYILSKGEVPSSAYQRVNSKKITGKDPLVSLQIYNPYLPEYLYGVINKGMKLEYTERYSTINDLQRALFPEILTPSVTISCFLVFVKGIFRGKKFQLTQDKVVCLGRGIGSEDVRNEIIYPDNPKISRGISRKHCAFYVDRNNRVYLRDLGSQFGTYLNGSRIQPGKWYRISETSRIAIGTELISLRRQSG